MSTLKIQQAHYDHMKSTIDETLATHNPNGELVHSYERGDFHNSEKTKDLQKRFCFDLLYGAGLTPWVCKVLYNYLNDDHIYSALKSICPQVTDPRQPGELRFPA